MIFNFYKHFKLGLVTEILRLKGSLSIEEVESCSLYDTASKFRNKSPKEIRIGYQKLERIYGKLPNELDRLIYEPEFFERIERKMKYIIPFSEKASFCSLIKCHRKAVEYYNHKQSRLADETELINKKISKQIFSK